jgi:tRNA nucleotidyltransferase (CCA-adding enzyme)
VLLSTSSFSQFGTPEQDATRRDFTINALFYNINTGAVEDFTGRGLEDLRTGVIRTPLAPKETFLDGEGTLQRG